MDEGHSGRSHVTATGRPPFSPEFRMLHPAIVTAWRLGGLMSAVFLSLPVGILEGVLLLGETPVPFWPLVPFVATGALFTLLVLGAIFIPPLQYRVWRYAVREHDILAHYGLVWRLRRVLPRQRLQHVDISSGPVDRMLGLVHLSLYTAGAMGAVIVIPGLAPADAEAIKEELLGFTAPSDPEAQPGE